FDAGTKRNRLGFLIENTISSDVMYMEAASFAVPPFHEQILVYERSGLSGRTGSLLFDGIIAALAILGGWVLLKKFTGEGFFIHLLFFVTAVLLFFLISLSWQRYFLIMQIPYSLLVGFGSNRIWLWLSNLEKQKPDWMRK
ncbi:MAG: hypothetical protein L6Q49_20365, partial [Anaerolineales bacterium]|nr:hypothetical protein [Anaerolineales bacterium]